MDSFNMIIDGELLENLILIELKNNGFRAEGNGDNINIYKDEYLDQHRDPQFLVLHKYSLTGSLIAQYEERNKMLISQFSKQSLTVLSVSYRRTRGYQLLYPVIDLLIEIINKSQLNEKIIIEEDYAGSFLLFNEFCQRWKLERGFFHNE